MEDAPHVPPAARPSAAVYARFRRAGANMLKMASPSQIGWGTVFYPNWDIILSTPYLLVFAMYLRVLSQIHVLSVYYLCIICVLLCILMYCTLKSVLPCICVIFASYFSVFRRAP